MFMSANVTSNGLVVPIRSNYQIPKISLGHGGENGTHTAANSWTQHSSESSTTTTLIKPHHHQPHHHHHHHPQPPPPPSAYPEYPLVMSVIPESITTATTTTTSGPGEQLTSLVTSSSLPDQSRSNSVNGRVNDVTLGHEKNKDTTLTKIFVGGLPYHTTDKSLRKFFETFGEIEEAVVITDRQTGKSRGYGFVTMADREAAERAVKHANPIIDGRKANVNLAYLGAKPRGSNSSSGLSFPVRGGYHPVIPNSQFGLAPNAGSYMYHPVATASPFISGAPLLLPQSGTYFEFGPPSATFAVPAPAQFVNGFPGYPHPQVAPSTSAATGPANASPFTANTFIPVEGRMQ